MKSTFSENSWGAATVTVLLLAAAGGLAGQASATQPALAQQTKSTQQAKSTQRAKSTERAKSTRQKRKAVRAKASAEPLSFAGARAEVYKEIGDVKLRLYVFEPKGHQPSDKRPAAVFFFGGGWNGGSPKQFEPHARHLTTKGMVAVLADYRVKSRQGTTPFECVKDWKSAIRWVRKHADRLGVDPNRIAAGGGSAGGHVAAATGNVPGLDEDADQSVSAVPNALLLFNPVYDNGPEGYGHDRVKDRYKEISPLHNIAKGTPPTIVFLGTKDKLIPVDTAVAYEAKMKAVGSRCVTHLYEDQPHGFFNKGRSGDKYYQATVAEMNKFLAELDWLKQKAE